MSVSAEPMTIAPGWLRGPAFDMGFIVGIALLALASGAAVVVEPSLLLPILFLDVWLLGYHHVVATFTRLCFDRASARRHRFLLFGLPPLLLVAVIALAAGVGVWILATIYLYWQWFHYTRQGWGIAQFYRRRADGAVSDSLALLQAVIYLPPLWGILYRSHQAPETFLSMELRVLPMPEFAVEVAAVAALAVIGYWLWLRAVAWWQGRLALAHTLFVLSHLAVFVVGYVVIEDITAGWLVVNIWHNAQYILFVWLQNNNRYKAGVEPSARFLSTISQTGNFWLYGVVCLGLSTAAYAALFLVLGSVYVGQNAVTGVALLMIAFQTINFHHYIVDAVIWRRRPARKAAVTAPAE